MRTITTDEELHLSHRREPIMTEDRVVGCGLHRRPLHFDRIPTWIDHNHVLFPWLTTYGMSEIDINWFKANPQSPDVLGLDYYPHSD